MVRTTSEPMLGEMRLAWWRERLEEMDEGVSAPDEPRLKAVERELKPRRISLSDLAGQSYAWQRLLEPFPWDTDLVSSIAFRGQTVFTLGTFIIAGPGEVTEIGGNVWALVDVARHCSDAPSRELLLAQARALARSLRGQRVPAALRPLSMLAVLAVRDCHRGEPFEAEGTPSRALAVGKHRLTGRFPDS